MAYMNRLYRDVGHFFAGGDQPDRFWERSEAADRGIVAESMRRCRLGLSQCRIDVRG
jgi:hypothetical protein